MSMEVVQQFFHLGILTFVMLTTVAWFIHQFVRWPSTSGWLWPWLRLHPWWPVTSDHVAEKLLRDSLSQEQYHQLRTFAYLEVPSPGRQGRVYRVPRGPGQVLVVEHGRVMERLCLQPMESLPEADVILMHKLFIEADEQTYLATANHFPRSAARW